MFGRRKEKSVSIPTDVDWSQRAHPKEFVPQFASTSPASLKAYQQRLTQAKAENIAWMREKKAVNNGSLVGFHGTSRAAGEVILREGFRNFLNEEGLSGVSMWDGVVAERAADFAQDRSEQAGEEGGGTVFEVRMHDPAPDTRYGRLEWMADADRVEVVAAYSGAEFAERLQQLRTDLGHTALSA